MSSQFLVENPWKFNRQSIDQSIYVHTSWRREERRVHEAQQFNRLKPSMPSYLLSKLTLISINKVFTVYRICPLRIQPTSSLDFIHYIFRLRINKYLLLCFYHEPGIVLGPGSKIMNQRNILQSWHLKCSWGGRP